MLTDVNTSFPANMNGDATLIDFDLALARCVEDACSSGGESEIEISACRDRRRREVKGKEGGGDACLGGSMPHGT